ncbi:MAG: glutamate--tRNA ligase family protein, partial [Halolamina sp.]
VYDYFDWEYPEVVHWGHVEVDAFDVPMSTSSIKEHIAEDDLTGWDDPRAPTLRAMRRRGIRGEAIVEAMAELGVSNSNVDLAMSSVYAANRELVDDEAPRRFLVRDGVEFALTGADRPAAGHPPVHPDHPERGDREVPAGDVVMVEPDDVPGNGERVWLKGYGAVRREDDAFVATSDDIDVVREGDVSVVHWVCAEESVPVRLRTPAGEETGRAEPTVADDEPDAVVQFERVGFARIDRHDDAETVTFFAHP